MPRPEGGGRHVLTRRLDDDPGPKRHRDQLTGDPSPAIPTTPHSHQDW
jgi:hypothetical protein